MTNCGEAKNEVQQRTKKSSHFQVINCGRANPKCSNARKNLVIFKWKIVEKRIRSAATHEKIQSFWKNKLWTSETEVQQRTKKSSHCWVAIEITRHDHSTAIRVRCPYILSRDPYLSFVVPGMACDGTCTITLDRYCDKSHEKSTRKGIPIW